MAFRLRKICCNTLFSSSRTLPIQPVFIRCDSTQNPTPDSQIPDTTSKDELFLQSIGKTRGIHLYNIPVDKTLLQVTTLLQRYGFPRNLVFDLIQKNPSILKCTEFQLETCLKSLYAYGLVGESLPSLMVSCPNIIDIYYLSKWYLLFNVVKRYTNGAEIIEALLRYATKFELPPVGVEKYEENVSFLLEQRFPVQSIGRYLRKCPKFFYKDRKHDFEPKMEILLKHGVKQGTVRHVMRKFPYLLFYSNETVISKLEYLVSLGLSKDDMNRSLDKFPGLLSRSVEDKMKPIVTELEELGFTGKALVEIIVKYPEIFCMKLGGEISWCVQILGNLHGSAEEVDMILQNGVVAAVQMVKARAQCLVRYGLSHREAYAVIKKEPRVVLQRVYFIERRMRYLVEEMDLPAQSVVAAPQYLAVGFSFRVVPRHKVIKFLKTQGLLWEEVSLRSIVGISAKDFYNRYVRPYPKCEEIYSENWNPNMYPKSEEMFSEHMNSNVYPKSEEIFSEHRDSNMYSKSEEMFSKHMNSSVYPKSEEIFSEEQNSNLYPKSEEIFLENKNNDMYPTSKEMLSENTDSNMYPKSEEIFPEHMKSNVCPKSEGIFPEHMDSNK